MDELHRHEAASEDGPTEASAQTVEHQTVEQRFLEHFGLNEQPFGVTPDPRFLYLGPKHRQALAALNYGTDLNRGFLTLIAPPGLGKTSLLFNYLEGLRNKARTAFVFQTDCGPRDLMAYVLADLGLNAEGKDLPAMHAMLNQVLSEEMRLGRRFILVIDEAQNLSEQTLESVRLLSNFETPWMKLMQIVLAGQPQLAERLAGPSMAQLQQRISFAIELQPLSTGEIGAYIDHRLWVAGFKGSPLFSVGARALIAEKSDGVPRKINNLCFCAMSFAWAKKQKTIDREMMREVLSEANMGSERRPEKIEAEMPELTESPMVAEPEQPSVMLQGSYPYPDQAAGILTIKELPKHGWLPKVAFAAAVLAVFGWFGLRMDVGKRVVELWDGISAAEKTSVAPADASAPEVSTIPDPITSPPTSSSNVSTGDQGAIPPQQVAGQQSTPSSQEPN